MSKRPRRNHTPAFKAKVALAAIKGDRTLPQLSDQFDVHPNQITSWKAQLEGSAVVAAVNYDGGCVLRRGVGKRLWRSTPSRRSSTPTVRR
jgi:hypothetical protein